MSRRNSSLFCAALASGLLVSAVIFLQIGSLDAAPSIPATTVVLNAIQDAYVDMGAPDSNFGSSDLYLGTDGKGNRRFVYLQFDVSAVPIGADIAHATLRLSQESATGPDPYWVWSWTAAGPWTEDKITWNNQPWGTNPQGSTIGLTLSPGTYFEWDVTAIVEHWVANGGPAYGIVLSGDNTTVAEHILDSRTGKAPQLEIAYTAADTPTPTPTSTATMTRTPTPTATSTGTRSSTPTATSTGTRSSTPTATRTPTISPTPTATRTGAPGDPPDLVLTDLWKDGNQVHFQIRNVGYGQAAPVFAQLYLNGQHVENSSLAVIASWARVDSYFPSPLDCSAKSVLARVCAEVTGAVDPKPGDNCLSKELPCDTTPPIFSGAPTVKDIGAGQATVCWNTAEKTAGRVLFDRLSGLWSQSATDGISAANHCVTLIKLEAAASYSYLVEIEDTNGNKARSKPGTFSTAPWGDTQLPILSAQVPTVISGTMTLLASASDNTGINRIRFLVDGKTAQTCYGPQCAFALDSTVLTDGAHNIAVQALDPAGNLTEFPAATQIRNSLDHMLSPVHVALLRPAEGAQVYGQVQVVAEVVHDLRLPLARLEFVVNGVVHQTINYPPCTRIRDETFCQGITPLRETFSFDTSGRTPGSALVVTVRAYDRQTPANWNETQRHVTVVEPPTPEVTLLRRVTRVGSHFDVELIIRNNGTVPVRPISFTDRSRRFQAAGYMQVAAEEPNPWGVRVPCQVSDESRLESTEITCQFAPSTLEPGRTRRVRYVLIPVMPPVLSGPITIGEQLQFSYESFGRRYQVRRADPGFESTALRLAALRESDYVIATSVEAGFIYGNAAATNRLMAARAELAEVRNGVFGDLSLRQNDDPEMVKRAFNAWASFLRPSWLASGYLLLTGSIPCKDLPTTYFTHDTDGWVRCSDNWYADTLGGDGLPNLRVGRLLGLYVDEEIWIRNSLQVVRGERSFDRSQAMMVSGPEGNWEHFASGVIWSADDLRRAASPTNSINIVHEEFYATPVSLRRDSLAILGTRWGCGIWQRFPLPATIQHLRPLICRWDYDDKTALPDPPPDLATLQSLISQNDAILVQNEYRPALILPYRMFGTGADPNADWTLAHDAAVADVTAVLPGSDIYYWSGHGAPGAWKQFTHGSFGNTSGVVLSNSCLTGKWQQLYAQSAPASAAQAGAAVFIGSTEVSPVGAADWATIKLPTWSWTASRSVGEALVQAKWAIGTGSAPGYPSGRCLPYYDLVIHEFNLYGDPKFGAVATTESANAPAAVEPTVAQVSQPSETVQVTIPAYQITQEAGIQRVTIPGGALTTEVGRPELPYYVYRQAVPAGQRVQSVRIVSRSQPAALNDLILPVFAANILGRPANQVNPVAPDEWYPPDDLAWNQSTIAGGDEELAVTLYPFRYNLARGAGQFYPNYTLEITYVPAVVSIVRLETDAPQYRQGEPVNMTLKLEAGAPTSGLMLGVAVENTVTGETIDGIPLRGLGELTGMATIEAVWQSPSAAPGEYALAATIEDSQGTVLARNRIGFRLGYPQGEVTTLTVTPDRFMPGATVQLEMRVQNTGDQPLTGVAVIEVHDGSGASVKRSEQEVLLKTSDAFLMQQGWNTAGLPPGAYRVLGYLEYQSRPAGVKTAAFRAGHALWLPQVLR